MTCRPKKKYGKSSSKHNQNFLYITDNLMLNLVIYVYPRPAPALALAPPTFTRPRTCDLYPRHLDILVCSTSSTSLCISGALYTPPYLNHGVRCAWCEAATTYLTMQLTTTSTSFISLQRKTQYKPAYQCVSGSKRNKCELFLLKFE